MLYVVSVFGYGGKKVLIVVSVFGSGGKKAVFLLWRESLLRPEKKVLVVCLAGCAVVSVFGSGDYDRKKSPSHLSGRESFITTGKKNSDRKKKNLVGRLAGCAVVSVFGSGGK